MSKVQLAQAILEKTAPIAANWTRGSSSKAEMANRFHQSISALTERHRNLKAEWEQLRKQATQQQTTEAPSAGTTVKQPRQISIRRPTAVQRTTRRVTQADRKPVAIDKDTGQQIPVTIMPRGEESRVGSRKDDLYILVGGVVILVTGVVIAIVR